MISSLIPYLLAALAGFSIVVQQALNSSLRGALSSAAWSGVASYFTGLICMVLLAVLLRDPVPTGAMASKIPWWAWCGGVFGATFIALGIYLVPVIGAATFIALLIAGQMIGAMSFDHFGWMGLEQRPIDVAKFLGAALLSAGVYLIKR